MTSADLSHLAAADPLGARAHDAAQRFAAWLGRYGETSQDHQDFYAGKIGRAAKAVYYRNRKLGTLAVLPMVFCEAFIPWTRRFFFPKMRLPISDAHFAMGFFALHHLDARPETFARGAHFLDVLKTTRCPAFTHAGWGYPFDWQTQSGVFPAGTPLITTTPYVYEAFADAYRIEPRAEWRVMMDSIARHVTEDYADIKTGPGAASCSYFPGTSPHVVNASAYRAAMLLAAARDLGVEAFAAPARHNAEYVLQSQNTDGSWPYATDGRRTFVDHFHTCFVLKGLAKIERIEPSARLTEAIERGLDFYLANLFDESGLPKPFARAPRLTVYRNELYDCAECLNLGVLLRGRRNDLDAAVRRTLIAVLDHWIRPCGAFRGRRLLIGWDDTPMHRWGQSQMFRSMALIAEAGRATVDSAASAQAPCAE